MSIPDTNNDYSYHNVLLNSILPLAPAQRQFDSSSNNLNNINEFLPSEQDKKPYKAPHLRNSMKRNNHEFLKTDRGKIMVFIDGSNLFYTAQMMGIEMDYIRLVEFLVNSNKLVRAYFYAGIDGVNTQSLNWQYFMKRTGFKMVTKQLQCFSDGNRKANCDVEMAVDMVTLSDAFDTAIVVTGDGDITYAVQNLVNKGKQVEVCGHRSNTNDTLINACDRFIDLENIREFITKNVK